MTFVIGRRATGAFDSESGGPAGRIGEYRALDGSSGAGLSLDFDGPHAVLVVGKRGYGKSYTLGVIAEELGRAAGVTGVVVDPMGVFGTLADGTVPARVHRTPRVDPGAIDPRSWCRLLELRAESAAGGLVWQAATERETLAGMIDHVASSDASQSSKRVARNHLERATAWDVFDPAGLSPARLADGPVTVLDVSGLNRAAANAVLAGVATGLYRARLEGRVGRLPWLLVDEAHVFFDGIAARPLETLLTRGRAPGVSLVAATQRPGVVPPVAVSQSDILVAHRLTARADVQALAETQPTYMDESLTARMPTEPGEVVVVDDATETVHTATVRDRDTPHGGESPSASDVDTSGSEAPAGGPGSRSESKG